jgi:5S rRNA maturation endonuclease (ribonuclease M5)
MNTKELALERAESLVREWLPEGKLEAGEWRCGGIDGSRGRSLSINLATGAWNDHATNDSGGDLIALLSAIRGISYKEAAQAIDGSIGNHRPAPHVSQPNDWELIRSVPHNASAPTFSHFRHGKPSEKWVYRNPDGSVFGYVARFDTPNGKEIIPLTYRRNKSGTDWRWKGFESDRPLYLVERLRPEGRVIIVEGEKCAKALADELPFENVVSWQGGAAAIKHSDWSPLKGRDVVVWPDHDEQGANAAMQIRRILGSRCRIAQPPADKPEKWDCHDAITEGFDCSEFLADPQVEDAAETGLPFRMLGVADDHFHYMPHNGNTIVRITAASHTKQNLMRLAPLQVWEDQFPGKNGVDWDAAVNSLLNNSQSLPQFDSQIIKGRGCWIDKDRVIFHAGDRLIVDGKEQELHRCDSENVFPARRSLKLYDGPAATDEEGRALLDLCQSLSWKDDLDGMMLAGWLALAPISGSIPWRPHLWVTGPSGTGKTWVFDNVVKRVSGDFVLAVQSNTTEAGIRCSLGSDSCPVIFDEAEAENTTAANRIERVMELARQASSEGSSGIVKGTASGGSVTHYVSSMFLFSSIGVSSVKKADTSRITSIELVKSNDREQFERVKQIWRNSAGQPDFPSKIRARSIRNARTIRENAKTFSAAAAIKLGDQRTADQIGALIAGAYSLEVGTLATLRDAELWIEGLDMGKMVPDRADTDESLCWSHLMGSQIGSGASAMTVSSAVTKAQGKEAEGLSALSEHGMRFRDECLIVANNGPALESIFKDTPWGAGKWSLQLGRLPGAERKSVRFSKHWVARSVSVPLP